MFLDHVHQDVFTLDHHLVAVQLDARVVVQLAFLHAEFPRMPGTDDAPIDKVALPQRTVAVGAEAQESMDRPLLVADRNRRSRRLPLQQSAFGQFVQSCNANECHV